MTTSKPPAARAGSYRVGDLDLNRIGYGAMQLAGPGVFGPPRPRGGSALRGPRPRRKCNHGRARQRPGVTVAYAERDSVAGLPPDGTGPYRAGGAGGV